MTSFRAAFRHHFFSLLRGGATIYEEGDALFRAADPML